MSRSIHSNTSYSKKLIFIVLLLASGSLVAETAKIHDRKHAEPAKSNLPKLQRDNRAHIYADPVSFKNFVASILKRAQQYLEEKDYPNALKFYQDAYGLDADRVYSKNDYAVSFTTIGNYLGEQQNYATAIESYKLATECEPGNSRYLANLATTYMHSKQFDLAIEIFDILCDLVTNNPVYFYGYGRSVQELLDYEYAIELYSKAILLDPTNPDYYRAREEAYFQQSKTYPTTDPQHQFNIQLAMADKEKVAELKGLQAPDNTEIFLTNNVLFLLPIIAITVLGCIFINRNPSQSIQRPENKQAIKSPSQFKRKIVKPAQPSETAAFISRR